MKNMMILALLVLASACGKNETKNSGDNNAQALKVPASLNFVKPAEGQMLSKEQVAEVKKTFGQKEMMTLPPGEMVFPARNSSPFSRQLQEDELAKNDPNAYSLLKDVRANCQKVRPTVNLEMATPYDGDLSFENLRLNDRLSYGLNGAINGGGACPVDVSADAGAGIRVEQIDHAAKTATISLGSSYKAKVMSLNPKYSNLLMKRGLVIDSSISGLASMADNLGSFTVNFKMTGSYYSLENEIPYSAEYKILVKMLAPKHSQTELVSAVTLKMPTYNVEVVVHHTDDIEDGKAPQFKSEFYVNGHLMTQKEMNDLLGQENPAVKTSSNVIIQTLK